MATAQPRGEDYNRRNRKPGVESRLLYGASLLRTGLFTAESLLLPVAEFVATRRITRLPYDLKLLGEIRESLRALLRADADRIAQGFYPAKVLLRTEPVVGPVSHVQRLPRIFRDAVKASRRRAQRTTKEFSDDAHARRGNLPAYYQRNFHFQTDGYLGEESAALYDHQVEILFAGSADSMRRLLLAPLKRHFRTRDGRGLRILELGCGSGSGTNFLRLAFPLAQITAVDLSEPYLEVARRRVPSVTFRQAAAEKLPYAKGSFDAVVSVFLFHELPLGVRKKVLAETKRVLKPEGVMAFVDSLQLGDNPKLDEPLRQFPVNFHEPFYPNYIRHPMEALAGAAGFGVREQEIGFFSKMQAWVPTPRARKKAPPAKGVQAKVAKEDGPAARNAPPGKATRRTNNKAPKKRGRKLQ